VKSIGEKFKKLCIIPFLLIFINLGFILFDRDVFRELNTMIPIIIFNVFISIDIVIRPISPKVDQYNRLIPAISFLSMPLLVILPYLEFKVIISEILILFQFSIHLFIIGVISSILGGFILLLSRIQLGKYGGPRIVIEDKHQLITNGIYKYIRHPMYLGFLFLFFGYSITFGSIIMTILITFCLFLIFKSRMEIEEKLLISEFGKIYQLYVERTKKLIPYLY
jgi:protein-S-isoprenylcysteine O-methyltransferase Ste14